jgi:hypothetical protein
VRIVFILLLSLTTLFLSGCAENPVVIRSADWTPSKKITVRLDVKKDLSYWEMWKPDSKDSVMYGIKKELEKASIPVVDIDPGVVLLVSDVKIGNWLEGFEVELLVISAIVDNKEIFRVSYNQKRPALLEDMRMYIDWPTNPKQIAKIMGRELVRQLKGTRRGEQNGAKNFNVNEK